MTIEAGKKVKIEYTLRCDGQEVDSNVGGDPLEYNHGEQNIVRGLENALEGMDVGEQKKVVVEASEGYGEHDKEAIIETDKEKVPEEARKVGVVLQTQSADGRVFQPRVVEVKDDKIVLDFNHPLAGKDLEFEVKVVDIE